MTREASTSLTMRNSTAEFLIFTQQAGEDGIEVRYENDTIWLTQKLMAELFGVDVRTISEHLQNIIACGELVPEAVIRKFRTTATDGKTCQRRFYNTKAFGAEGGRMTTMQGVERDNCLQEMSCGR